MPVQSTLLKKTKQELLSEYEKMAAELDELKMTSKMIHKPESLEIISKAREHTAGSIGQSVSDLKKSVNGQLENLAGKLNATLNGLTDEVLSEVDKFDELQKAIDISKKNLQVQYHIQTAAETLESLVKEYGDKKTALEAEYERRREEIEAEIAAKKKIREREEEEHGYATELERKRSEAAYNEERTKKENELAERLAAIRTQEDEITRLKDEAQKYPEKLEKETAAREKEILKNLQSQFDARIEALKKDYEAEKKLNEFKVKNLEDTIKRQEAEIILLKKEAELAVKKAQELAIKIVESGARANAPEPRPAEKNLAA